MTGPKVSTALTIIKLWLAPSIGRAQNNKVILACAINTPTLLSYFTNENNIYVS